MKLLFSISALAITAALVIIPVAVVGIVWLFVKGFEFFVIEDKEDDSDLFV